MLINILILMLLISQSYEDINAKTDHELIQVIQRSDLKHLISNEIKHVKIKTLEEYKELILRTLGPDKFLKLVVDSICESNLQDKNLQLLLAGLAYNSGADISFRNNEFWIELLLSFDDNKQLINFFMQSDTERIKNQEKLEEITESGLLYVLDNPQLIVDQKYKNLDAQESPEPKMPYIIHHIWLTHPESPREIREVDRANALATKALFSKAGVQWQHIVWTNDPLLIPQSAAQLEQADIEVKCIYEHKNDLKLFSLIETLIEKKQWGKASDTLRVALLEHLGGVYTDLNYIFNRDVTSEVHKYHFFTSTYKDHFIANFFFGSAPGHPILQKALSLIERNLLTPPAYVGADTMLATANPIYLAYYSQANQNGNIDIIYPSTSYYRRAKMGPNAFHQPEKTLKPFPENEVARTLSKTLYPMTNLDIYIQAREICGTEEHFIGYDSPDGGTWKSK